VDLAQLAGVKIAAPEITFSIIYKESVVSTNSTAYEMARQGAPEGVVIVADTQHGGRGRLERSWFSPAGKNIYASCLLKPSLAPHAAAPLSLIAGLAVQQALSEYLPDVTLKWPNDVLVADKKICGILSEIQSTPQEIEFVIIGIGININQALVDFEDALQDSATSLFIETGYPCSRAEVLKKVLARLGELYYRYQHFGFASLKSEWKKSSRMLGKQVAVNFGGEVLVVKVLDISEEGLLVCRQDAGTIVEINAGEATIIKEKRE